MLLYLLLSAVESGSGGLEIPPPGDPTGRIIALVLAFLAVAGPYLTAKVSAKKGALNGPAPRVTGGSPTPQLDANQKYLEQYLQGLEDSLKEAKTENVELRKLNIALVEDRAVAKTQNEALREDIAQLRGEVRELQGRLRGPRDV